MKVLLVDDEPIARQVLREMIEEEFAGVRVAGEAADGLEALAMIERVDPDVVLLDLEMPRLRGLDAARALGGGRRPAIIYVTAYEQHALEAFETGAVDYLLKPVRKERLAAALERVKSFATPAAPAADPRKIVGRAGNDYHLLDPREVIAFQAHGEVVYIVTTGARFYSNYSLRALEARLPASRFRRIHRQTIINTDHVRKISPLSSKRWLLKMSNGMEVIVSKRLAGVIREQTNW